MTPFHKYPDDPNVAEFLRPKAPEEFRQIFETPRDPEDVRIEILRRLGDCFPKDWPRLRLSRCPTRDIVRADDMASSVALTAIITSPLQQGVENMPRSFWSVRDGIWIPREDMVFLWTPIGNQFMAASDEEIVKGTL